MMRADLEHIHEHFDQVENTSVEQPQPIFQGHGRGLQLEDRLMTIIGMSVMKGRTQWVVI